MPDPVAFDFPTAQALVRLLKRAKNGELTNPIHDEIPVDGQTNFVWSYVPSTVTCTYDSTVKAWSIGGATTCYPINTGQDSSGLIQWGKTDNNGVISGGITCTTFTPKLTSGQAAPVVGKGFYLGCVFAADSSENPRVLIGLPPVSGSSGGSATIEVVTDVICTPTGIEVSTVTLSGADYDNAVIRQFLALSDVTPSSYLGNQGRVVKVNDTATGLEFGAIGEGPTYTTFIALSDTPSEWGSNAYKVLTVGSNNSSVTFSANNITTTNSLTGGGNPNDPSWAALKLVNDTANPGSNYIYGTNSSGVKGWKTLQLTSLTDFPSTAANAGKFLTVNSSANGVQWTAVDIAGMLADIADLKARVAVLEGA